MTDLGPLLLQATDQDTTDAGGPLPLFAVSVAQQLCFWANSNACSQSDPVFRGIVADFVSSNYNFPALVKELFSSALVTGAAATTTYPADSSGNETVPISISRQAHLCAALSNRMGISDVCALQAAVPTSAQTHHADHRRQRGGRRVQPRIADPGHAGLSRTSSTARRPRSFARTSPSWSST